MAEGEPPENLKVPQEQIDALIAAVERMERRRKIMLWGYVLAALVLVLGQIVAFVIVARAPRSAFVAWVYLIPFTLVGGILLLFGRLTGRRSRPPPRS